MDELLMTTQEVADYLKVSRKTVIRLCNEGDIPFIKVGRNYRFKKQAIIEYVDTQQQNQTRKGEQHND